MYDFDRYEQPVTRYGTLEDFMAADSLPSGIIEIGWLRPIHILCKLEDSRTASIHFHAAIDRDAVTLPMFSGLNVTAGTGVNSFYISDTTLALDPKLGLGWFAGGDGLPLQRVLPLCQGLIGHAVAREI